MGWFGDIVNAVAAPFVAPVAAAVNIVKGDNVLQSATGGVLGTVGSSNALANAASGGNLGKLPVIGSPFASSTAIVASPFDPKLQKIEIQNWGKAGLGAAGFSASGAGAGLGGLAQGGQVLAGNYSALAGVVGDQTGMNSDLTSFISNALKPKPQAAPGRAPASGGISDFFSNPSQVLTNNNDLVTLAVIAAGTVAAYYYLRKK